jgi:hypothetical protein
MTVSYTTDAKQAPTLFPLGKEDATPDTALTDAIYLVSRPSRNRQTHARRCSSSRRRRQRLRRRFYRTKCLRTPHTFDQLLAFAMKQPVQIYSMMIADDWGTANAGSACNQIPKDENTLDELAGATGGHAYIASNSQGGVNSIATEVARALKTQFLVGYKSTNTAKDGHRRGVKVKVNPPDGSPKLKVWTKSAYYAPKAKS